MLTGILEGDEYELVIHYGRYRILAPCLVSRLPPSSISFAIASKINSKSVLQRNVPSPLPPGF